MGTTPNRRQDTRARIIDVATRLLHDNGAAAVTTRGVAELAGVQPPAIYRLFGDKDGLLEAVAEHVMASYVADKSGAVASAATDGVDPVEDLRAGWQTHIQFGLANPALFHLLNDPTRRSPAYEAGREVLRARINRVAAIGRLRVSEDRATDLFNAAGVGVITTLLSTPPAQRDNGLADSMLEAALGQILTANSDPLDDDSSHAVALRAAAPSFQILTAAERHLFIEWLDRIVG